MHEEMLGWKLLTTANAASLEDAIELVFLYAKRWLI
jgi:hypothetical protein